MDRNRPINLNQAIEISQRIQPKQAATDYNIPSKARCVTLQVPHNAAVQLYDYKSKNARVVFGPDLALLDPDEQFTVLSLSGDKPKQPNVIKSLVLLLGPDFCTDYVTVETLDHARLKLSVSYNWSFDMAKAKTSADNAAKTPFFRRMGLLYLVPKIFFGRRAS